MEAISDPAFDSNHSIRDVLEQNMQDGTAIREAIKVMGEQNPHLLHAVLAISQDRQNMMDRQELIAFAALVASEGRRQEAAQNLYRLVGHEITVEPV